MSCCKHFLPTFSIKGGEKVAFFRGISAVGYTATRENGELRLAPNGRAFSPSYTTTRENGELRRMMMQECLGLCYTTTREDEELRLPLQR